MKIPVVLFFLLFVYGTSFGQKLPEKQVRTTVFDSFHSSLNELKQRYIEKSEIESNIANSLGSIADNVKFLEAVMSLGKPVPKEYLESLALDAELLKRFARQEAESASELKALYEGLKEVELDLAIKVTGPRSGGEVTRVVQVVVQARKDEQYLDAYEVWYVPRGWAKEATRFKPFDRLTNSKNPTSMNLAPGNYFIWLKKGQPIGDRRPVSVGENGENKTELELPVP